jgi:hypothetical protein
MAVVIVLYEIDVSTLSYSTDGKGGEKLGARIVGNDEIDESAEGVSFDILQQKRSGQRGDFASCALALVLDSSVSARATSANDLLLSRKYDFQPLRRWPS